MKSGAKRELANLPECGDPSLETKCQKYVFVSHIESLGNFLFAKLFYESVEYLLIDDHAGTETLLHAFPTFSPSGNHVLLLIMNDDQIGFAVQMWRREGPRFVLDWSGSPYTDGIYTSYQLIRWTEENKVVLRADVNFEPPRDDGIREFTLSHSANGWGIVGTR